VSTNFDFVSNSPDETIEFGRKLGSQLKGSEIIALCGPLGSGKTHLIKGIAAGAGAADQKNINSPTFVIVNEYSGRLDIYHIDAYRLSSVSEFEMLGFDDFCYPQSVVLIEWADRVKAALKNLDCLRIELEHVSGTTRRIHVKNIPDYISIQAD
jgi:tRNA threonylcarbamoyladenosine biosynthesis protein TsaE